MNTDSTVPIADLRMSLSDLLGEEYIQAACEARAFIEGRDPQFLRDLAEERIAFYPEEFQKRVDELVEYIGKLVCGGYGHSSQGSSTSAFRHAAKTQMSPLTGLGCFRVGEDGKLYLISKSEHYHASLGHSFPGYALLDRARSLGIPNATHNNTRGHITRVLEKELIRTVNGLKKDDKQGLQQILESSEPHVLNRVLNLETGSLAVEAALKMMLARFYRLEKTFDPPKYYGKVPVFLVIADNDGGKEANYHGTTILTQAMRGLWPEFYAGLEAQKLMLVQSVNINDIGDFERKMAAYDTGEYKVAGFFHEIILMNYGGVRLREDFLQWAYTCCRERDVPIIVDEIQSCIWSPELFLFKEYGLTPDFVSLGKGFPGGEYPASRLITTAPMDNLNQFGALVTNGQEELASLAYLITMEFAQANAQHTKAIGEFYEQELRTLARKYPHLLDRIEGQRHLSALYFFAAEKAVAFCKHLNKQGIDISAQTYKAQCPPSALTKLPLTASAKMVEFVISKMDQVLRTL
ncbi:MAG: aminotransferase class III-fold pyridoxal phosphate-dependent enzyme [Candidatus Vecturithrix sp.]|jgi:acetylornithine/succinyldiaminopimelate/putrescine aminotransferase|nr:aminotransferase class III-fold pyridoxal phosphate-dependent enzyme [Candidatus Vecturithrix sp.]